MPKSQSGQKEPSCSPSSNRRLTERENRIFFAPEVVQERTRVRGYSSIALETDSVQRTWVVNERQP